MVEVVIVCEVDEELGRCRVWVGSRHRERSAQIRQTIVGLKRYRFVHVPAATVRLVTSGLYHKARYYPIDNGSIEMVLGHIAQEILYRLRCVRFIEFNR